MFFECYNYASVNLHVDHQACLRYANGCYCNGKYKDCILWCDYLRQHASDEGVQNSAKLLKGKALYCCSEAKLGHLLKIKSSINPVHELPKLMNKCIAEMKESILLLGTASDHYLLDDEGSKLLDWAMINFIREANQLNSCNRCLLCRKKTTLKRSHIYSRSVLKEIAKPIVNDGEHRIYLHELKGKLSAKSAGEVTYWMFCGICEERFSQNGENEFCKEFFTPIFQASQPELSKKEHLSSLSSTVDSIEYGQWLYNFCIGLLFRGLGISMMPQCRNNEKIYAIFLKFRRHLLSLPVKTQVTQTSEQKDACSHPMESSLLVDSRKNHVPVTILISPTSERETYFPASLLNSSGSGLASLKLDGQPTFILDAPFFSIRLGLVNILVEFDSIESSILHKKI